MGWASLLPFFVKAGGKLAHPMRYPGFHIKVVLVANALLWGDGVFSYLVNSLNDSFSRTVDDDGNAVIEMVEEEKYCPDIMKQVSALQASLEKVNRVLLQNHLETCVTHAVSEGRTAEIVDELLETMKYTAAVTGPGPYELETP